MDCLEGKIKVSIFACLLRNIGGDALRNNVFADVAQLARAADL